MQRVSMCFNTIQIILNLYGETSTNLNFNTQEERDPSIGIMNIWWELFFIDRHKNTNLKLERVSFGHAKCAREMTFFDTVLILLLLDVFLLF